MGCKKKKGQMGFNVLLGAAIALVVLVVGVAFGIQLMQDQKTESNCNTGYTFQGTLTYPNQCCEDGLAIAKCKTVNITSITNEAIAYKEGVTGIAKFPAKTAMLAGIVILIIVIGLLLSLTGRKGR